MLVELGDTALFVADFLARAEGRMLRSDLARFTSGGYSLELERRSYGQIRVNTVNAAVIPQPFVHVIQHRAPSGRGSTPRRLRLPGGAD